MMRRDEAIATAGPLGRVRRAPRAGRRADAAAAARADGLVAHYQPIMRLVDGAVAAREALLRVPLPEGGLGGPKRFLATCERNGAILEVGAWVLREACSAATRWDDRAGVAVNVSPHQLVGEHLPATVEQALAGSGLEPARLCLELTESALLDGLPQAARTLSALRALGVRVAIDDFGVGHASIERLRHCPADQVKLDRSFVAGLGRDRRDTAIVQLTAELAAAFGLEAVAEGVETPEQANAVGDLGFAYAQGFYFARPCPAPVAAG